MATKLTPKLGSEHIVRMSQFPSIGEVVVAVLFLIAWLFPVIVTWGVSISGHQFSFVAQHLQNQNADIVGICILVALISGTSTAIVVLIGVKRIVKLPWPNLSLQTMNGLQRFFLVIVSLIAAIGLFKSFGGTIFEKSYVGPSIVWLGYGAWSVTFLLAFHLLIGDFLSSRPFHPVMVLVITVAFLPFLLSGSRIDFLSSMLALAAYAFILSNAKFKMRTLMALAILVWGGAVAFLVAKIRYASHDTSLVFTPIIPVKAADHMLYLSTIGDIGASVFQIVGLMQEQVHRIIGIGEAVLSYTIRLLPGPFYTTRPEDFWARFPEQIGGGALHSLGEGYLISGIGGCALVAAVYGGLIALSISAGKCFRVTKTPVSWIIFMFPWLMLIRGGWYQFFALIKTMEILLSLLFILVAIGWLGTKFSMAHSKEHACH